MGAKLKAIFVFLFLSAVFLHSKTPVLADNDTEGVVCSITVNDLTLSTSQGSTSVPISPISQTGGQGLFQVKVCNDQGSAANQQPKISIDTPGIGAWAEFALIADGQGCYTAAATLDVGQPTEMAFDVESSTGTPICRRVYANLQGGSQQTQKLWDDSVAKMCAFQITPSTNITNATPVSISSLTSDWFQQQKSGDFFKDPQGRNVRFKFFFLKGTTEIAQLNYSDSTAGITYNAGNLGAALYNYEIRQNYSDATTATTVCAGSFTVGSPQNPGGVNQGGANTPEFNLCKQTANNDDLVECGKCFAQVPPAIWTAFGCIPTSKEGIVVSFIRIGLGISGGFVLLSILYGAFLITTSSGDPKRVQEGQEMVTSAVMGLLFVIFSIIILRFIGVSLLQIPGFGT